MNAVISIIPNGLIYKFIPALAHHLERSEYWSKGRSNVDDIVRFIYTGQMQLWVIFDEEEKSIGYVVTEIKQYPQSKMLVWQYGAGDYGVLEATNDLVFETIERFAKDTGCNGLEVFGRPGWKREAKRYGFNSQTVMYEKFFG